MMGIGAMLGRAVIALVLSLVVLLGIQTWRLNSTQVKLAEAQATLANERAVAAAIVAAAQDKVRKTEQLLMAVHQKKEAEKDAQIRALGHQRDALVVRVRRAEANAARVRVPEPTAVAAIEATSEGSHPSELLGSIGSKDVEEAYRADTIRIELLACYDQYEAARQALKQ